MTTMQQQQTISGELQQEQQEFAKRTNYALEEINIKRLEHGHKVFDKLERTELQQEELLKLINKKKWSARVRCTKYGRRSNGEMDGHS